MLVITNLPTWSYGTTYSVRVAIKLGSGSYGSYGVACTVTTPSVPITKVRDAECGKTLSKIDTSIYANTVAGATGYKFEVSLGAIVLGEVQTTSSFFSLVSIASWNYNTTYSVRVAVKINTGSYGAYGDACNVKTPDPFTTISAAMCNNPDKTSSDVLTVDSYVGATGYQFVVEYYGVDGFGDLVLLDTYTQLSSTNSISVSSFLPQLLPNTEYSWGVAVRLYGKYTRPTKGCSFTYRLPSKMVSPITRVDTAFRATAYPNPFANDFMIDVKTSSQSLVNLKVYDMLGRLIEQRDVRISDLETTTIGERYPSGVYNVVVSQQDDVQTVRVVKR